ncbi:ABC transporter permease [Vagococcus elongatus]|uniref:Peptide ABC transporter n=1 Tax=Vagococcus elongatus TaxID=180344 RepID=A0A430AHR5_9ENTE|nr:ABC transporter permease [Vagococcus elongatus]RSU07642.1 peptide ABC transporter [Vagococcus elongatus]
MGRFIGKRLFGIIPTLFGLILLIFLLSRIMPGDSVRLALGPEATPEQIVAMEEKLGLNNPIPIQFINYIRGLFTGDMGMSLRTGRNVLLDIKETFPATFELSLISMIISVAVGVPLGILSAIKNNNWADHLIRIFSLSGIALPRFWLAILLQLVFSYWLGVFPVIGRGTIEVANITGLRIIDSLITGNIAGLSDSLLHILLPALSLSMATAAQIMRMTRTNMLDQVNKDYVLAAESYGLPENLVYKRYMLKNAFISVLTTIGMQFGSLIGNAFLVETVFGWPGMAQYAIQGIMYKDYNAITGVTLIIGFFFVIINVIVDLLYGLFDPRIKLES